MLTNEEKIEVLTGEFKELNPVGYKQVIQHSGFLDDDFVKYAIKHADTTRVKWDDDVLKEMGIEKYLISKQGENRENLILALAKNNINLKDIVKNLEDDKKSEINNLINKMANDGKFKTDKLSNLMNNEDFNKYYKKNEEKFHESIIRRLLDKGVIEDVSERTKKILLNNCSYDTCKKYFEKR